MKTHTIKWNGTRKHRIVTFTPQYLKILETSHRDSVSLIIMKLLKDLSNLTGIKHTIDYDSQTVLDSHLTDTNVVADVSKHYLKMWFEQGYLNSTLCDCEKDIQSLNLFYNTFFKS